MRNYLDLAAWMFERSQDPRYPSLYVMMPIDSFGIDTCGVPRIRKYLCFCVRAYEQTQYVSRHVYMFLMLGFFFFVFLPPESRP